MRRRRVRAGPLPAHPPAKIQPGIGEVQTGPRHNKCHRRRSVVHLHPETSPILNYPRTPLRSETPIGEQSKGQHQWERQLLAGGEQLAFPISRLDTFKTTGSKAVTNTIPRSPDFKKPHLSSANPDIAACSFPSVVSTARVTQLWVLFGLTPN